MASILAQDYLFHCHTQQEQCLPGVVGQRSFTRQLTDDDDRKVEMDNRLDMWLTQRVKTGQQKLWYRYSQQPQWR
ncbi:hypothetical protein [Mixta mediterraneensis]|uniref:hypothetical protein n=1 Tax=Mixta mediterraneensis TaxID=2758443 RepID=UPI001876C76C|nr:hypothetical protein [Mixta mediterraneensis]